MNGNETTHRTGWLVGGLLLAAWLLPGCAGDSRPTASDTSADLAPQAAFSIGFHDLSAPAAKSLGKDRSKLEKPSRRTQVDDSEPSTYWEVSEEIGPRGGTLGFRDKGRSRDGDGNRLDEGIEVEFKVPRDAVDAPQLVTMTVSGYDLTDLEIWFEPTGLEFRRDAKLKIHVGADRVGDVDVAQLVGYHSWEGGEATVETTVDVGRNGDVVINVRVPGFSRYSLGE